MSYSPLESWMHVIGGIGLTLALVIGVLMIFTSNSDDE